MADETIVATPPSEENIMPEVEVKEEIVSPNPSPNPLENNLSKKQILLISLPLILIVLGLSGFYAYQIFIKPSLETTPPIVTQEETLPLTLAITSPSEDSIINDSLVTVKGVTLPNTTVFLYTEENENSVDSDAKGNFEGQIELADGINTLTVTAFGENGEEKTLAYDLVYDNQVMGVKNTPTKTSIDNSGKKAVVGNVEKVTTNSVITEKNRKTTEIQIDKNTKIINQNKKQINLNSLKKSDITAIITDDEIATSSRQLKKALKIYVKDATASAQAQSKRKAISGVIQSVSGNLITLTHQIQIDRVYQLYINTSTVVKIKDLPTATIADLKAGQRIAAVGDLNEEGQLVAKRIHVIPGKATGVMNKYPSPAPTSAATPSGSLTTTPTATPSGTLTITPTPTVILTPTVTSTPTPIVPTPTIETPSTP